MSRRLSEKFFLRHRRTRGSAPGNTLSDTGEHRLPRCRRNSAALSYGDFIEKFRTSTRRQADVENYFIVQKQQLRTHVSIRTCARSLIADMTSPTTGRTVQDLPNRYAFFYRQEHRVFFRHVECLIPSTDLRQCTVYAPFAQ